ncbi:MAG: PAS domain S-box protein, partial [bacterium]|nr:PAS domain S-box protein [bacterium]
MDATPANLAPWALLEHMTVSVLVTTPDLDRPGPSILYVNPAFGRMTGWSRDEVIGTSPRFLQGRKSDLTVFADLRARLEGGQVWRGQTVNYRKDGSEFVMEWSIVPLVDDRGVSFCHLAVQQDVTERVTLERHLASARAEEQKWLEQMERTNRELRRLNDEQQRTLNLFVKYVPDTVIRRGLEAGDGSLFHGDRLHVALLFCDLRGFTRVSESMSPDGIVALLNTYYRLMSEEITAHEGVITQFVGDEIFVTFGAPLPLRDSTDKAARCALAMVARMDEINSNLQDLTDGPLYVGIGVHYGQVVAGNLGSENQLSYSITGDAVNT